MALFFFSFCVPQCASLWLFSPIISFQTKKKETNFSPIICVPVRRNSTTTTTFEKSKGLSLCATSPISDVIRYTGHNSDCCCRSVACHFDWLAGWRTDQNPLLHWRHRQSSYSLVDRYLLRQYSSPQHLLINCSPSPTFRSLRCRRFLSHLCHYNKLYLRFNIFCLSAFVVVDVECGSCFHSVVGATLFGQSSTVVSPSPTDSRSDERNSFFVVDDRVTVATK